MMAVPKAGVCIGPGRVLPYGRLKLDPCPGVREVEKMGGMGDRRLLARHFVLHPTQRKRDPLLRNHLSFDVIKIRIR